MVLIQVVIGVLNSVSEKPSDTAKKTETVVKQTVEGTVQTVSTN